jgi:hypothetical protein
MDRRSWCVRALVCVVGLTAACGSGAEPRTPAPIVLLPDDDLIISRQTLQLTDVIASSPDRTDATVPVVVAVP